jgi:[ribosomal protein S5]-alanine N-acetyltransferase
VRLRPIRRDDLDTMFAWANDPDLVAPFDRFQVDTFDRFRAGVESAGDDPYSLAPRFAVERTDNDRLIGFVGHYNGHPVLEYIDVWYVLGVPAERGRGFGREAVRLLVSHLFSTSAVERVGASCDVDNPPSYRLLEGLGFRREGTFRSALFHHGRWHDVYHYGITRPEWRDRRPAG